MKSPINTILRQSTRKKDEKYNILTVATHEGYQHSLSQTNAEYYFFFTEGLKRWRHDYRKLPSNCHILPDNRIPDWIDFDFCLSQSRFGQLQALKPIADRLHLNIVHAEHTDRMPFWSDKMMDDLKSLKTARTYFITNYSRTRWGYSEDEAGLIPHGVDTDLFCPNSSKRRYGILSVVNDFVNRGAILGFDMWQRLVKNLPIQLVGDTPPISRATYNIEELVDYYQSASVFLNTSLYSPIPTVMLEAASAGCAIVSTNNCAIPDIFTNGYDAFLSNDETELRKNLELLVKNNDLAREMGNNARKTIMEKFPLHKFIENWNNIFDEAASIVYTGE